MTDNILEVRDLSTRFFTRAGVVRAVEHVSFSVARGSTLALVGESGSGKSVTSLSLMRLVPPPGEIVSGEILFDGRDLLKLSAAEMRALRGRRIAMIFQDPMTSLNPVYTVGDQIAEVLRAHEGLARKQAWARAVELMDRVLIPDAARRADDYPHQLSGGMRQRVMIAMALACSPRLLIADEPTTALDVTIQAEILELLRRLKSDFDLSMLLITHDLGVVAETATSVAVMYAGRIVEQAPVADLFSSPRHPYTEGLLRSVPTLFDGADRRRRLETIEGSVPDLIDPPRACAFASRCSYEIGECTEDDIPLYSLSGERSSRCLRSNAVGDRTAQTHPERSGRRPALARD
jgi:oligopeptide/dipeptide ABC transporter ATP-binding protein